MVPPCSDRISRVPPYSSELLKRGFRRRGYHPVSRWFPTTSAIACLMYIHWAVPLSLAATHRISVDFFSSGYWDVSVPRVSLLIAYVFIKPCHITVTGCPIQTSPDHCLFASSPKLFAGYHVFRRLWLPRHPPYAFCFLIISLYTGLTLYSRYVQIYLYFFSY